MPPIIVAKALPSFLHPHARCDNGRLVHWANEQAIASSLNKVAKNHTKTVFVRMGQVSSIIAKGGAGQRKRWRCAWHSGPFARRVRVAFVIAQGQVVAGDDPYGEFAIAGGGSCQFHFGSSGSDTNTPNTLGYGVRTVDIDPDTEYTALFSDYGNCRMVGACVWEESLAPDVANGYAEPAAAVQAPIFRARRAAAMAMGDLLWNRGAAHLFTWTCDQDSDARTRTLTSDANLVDTTVTTITTHTPGWKWDLQHKRTRMHSTVPVRFRACGLTAVAGTGHVYIKDSGGSILATIPITGTSEAWSAGVDVEMPATEAKYDVHLDGDGTHQTKVFAVAGYEFVA